MSISNLSGKILVTGGAGFIGSNITEHLVSDNDVRVLDALTTGSTTTVPDEAQFQSITLGLSESVCLGRVCNLPRQTTS